MRMTVLRQKSSPARPLARPKVKPAKQPESSMHQSQRHHVQPNLVDPQATLFVRMTERTEHLDAILLALAGVTPPPFVLHGRMSKKQRAALIAELDALAPEAPRILLSTGKLVGEGFDHPPLDTLVLAMPVSWKGTLQQYAGRLHREHASKTDVRIIDFVDTGHPALLRMWDKRQRGYRAMGYRLGIDATGDGGVLLDD